MITKVEGDEERLTFSGGVETPFIHQQLKSWETEVKTVRGGDWVPAMYNSLNDELRLQTQN